VRGGFGVNPAKNRIGINSEQGIPEAA